MRGGLNLSKFKKMKEDKDFATLIHSDGHQLVIAKAPLSPLHRKQLENLEIHQYAQGGKLQPAETPFDVGQAQDDLLEQETDKNLPPPTDAPTASAPDDDVKGPVQSNDNSLSASDVPYIQNAPQTGQQNLPPPGPGEMESQAIRQEGQNGTRIDYPVGLETQVNLPRSADIAAYYDGRDKELGQKLASGEVDPQHYMGEETKSRMPSNIGVIISSIGQAIGQGRVPVNGALQEINNQLNRDILQQQNDQSAKMNLWKMNMDVYHNKTAATLATQNQMLEFAKHGIMKAAQQSHSKLENANAALAIQELGLKQMQNNKLQALLHGPTQENQDPAALIPALVPTGLHGRAVDEQNAAKVTVQTAPDIFDAFHQAARERNQLGVPFRDTPGAARLKGLLAPTVIVQEGTSRQAATDALMDAIIPKRASADDRVETQFKTLNKYLQGNSARASANATGGIDLSKYKSTNTRAIDKPLFVKQVRNGKAYKYKLNLNTGKYE
jgi:hypothetical protein